MSHATKHSFHICLFLLRFESSSGRALAVQLPGRKSCRSGTQCGRVEIQSSCEALKTGSLRDGLYAKPLLDGQLLKKFPGVRLLHEHETLEGHKLYLGNSADLSCPWAGSLIGFDVYGKAWALSETTEDRMTAAHDLVPCEGESAAVACYRFEVLTEESVADLSGSAND